MSISGREMSIVLAILASIWSMGGTADTHASLDSGAGKPIYEQTCTACHGPEGHGKLPGVPDLTESTGPLSKSKAELIRNVTEGYQTPGSLLAMPPKGGNPALTEEDIRNVVEYILQEFGGKNAGCTAVN